MFKHLSIALLIAILAGGTIAAQPVPEPVAAKPWIPITLQPSPAGFRTPDNAALLYYQALIKLDRDKAGTLKPDNAPADWTPDAAGIAVLDEQATVIGGLIRASQISNCDWGYEYGLGWSLELPHFGALRTAARLLDADARRLITNKAPPGEVAARLAAMLRMADHTTCEPVLIGCLVGTAMTALATDTVDHALARGALDGPSRDTVLAAAKSLLTDDPMNFKAALRNEQRISRASVEAMLTGKDPALAAGLRAMFASDPVVGNEGMPAADAAADALAKLDGAYDEMLKAWGQPNAKELFGQLEVKVERGRYGLYAKVLLPALNKAHESAQKTKARLEQLIKSLEQYIPPAPAPK